MIIHQLLLYIDKYLLIINFGLYYEELRKMVPVLLARPKRIDIFARLRYKRRRCSNILL